MASFGSGNYNSNDVCHVTASPVTIPLIDLAILEYAIVHVCDKMSPDLEMD